MHDIAGMKGQGASLQAISRLVDFDRKTGRKYLIGPVERPEYRPRPRSSGRMDSSRSHLERRLRAGVWNAQVLLCELRDQCFDGRYTILTNWFRLQRQEARAVAVRRFETLPGRQARAD